MKTSIHNGLRKTGFVVTGALAIGSLLLVSQPQAMAASPVGPQLAGTATPKAKTTPVVKNDKLAWRKEGESLFKARDYKGAINAYTQAIKLGDNIAETYAGRGEAYIKIGKYQAAIDDLDIAIEKDDSETEYLLLRGRAYGKLGQREEAFNDFEAALKLDSSLARAHIERGDVYYDANEYDEAIEYYDKALELDEDSSTAYNNRGNAYSGKAPEGDLPPILTGQEIEDVVAYLLTLKE